MSRFVSLAGGVFAAMTILIAGPAGATVWTDWTSATTGQPGSAIGTLGGVTVRYAGEVDGAITNGTSNIWQPDSTFIGGASTTSPSTVGDDIRLNGSFEGTNVVSFDSPVQNPLIAIWSLGQPALQATFTFQETPIFQAGGPNSQFGGAAIGVAGNVVSGAEGNGVVQFSGTFDSISWTNSFENFYAFTVGIADEMPPIPQPSTLGLIGLGLLGLGLVARVRRMHVPASRRSGPASARGVPLR